MKFAHCSDLMYYIGIRKFVRSYPMQEIVNYFKEMFMMKNDDKKIGLSQFKSITPIEKPKVNPVKPANEVKLSDLMRRSYN